MSGEDLILERLARIEAQVKLQTQAYVYRIQELTRELQAAREENRELIKVRIAQVKMENSGSLFIYQNNPVPAVVFEYIGK